MSGYSLYDCCYTWSWSWDYDYGSNLDDEEVAELEYINSFLPEDLFWKVDLDEYETTHDKVRAQLAAEHHLLLAEEKQGGGQTQSRVRSRFRARNFRR